MTQDEIMDALEDEREKFMDVIEGLSEETLLEPGVVGDWSIKDVMAHLSAWEAELIKLLWQVQQRDRPSSAHFAHTPVDELNELWHAESQGRELERVMADFQAVRKQTLRRIENLSNRDLNDAERFSWAKGKPLWEWIADDSFGHEAEHAAQIQAWRISQEAS